MQSTLQSVKSWYNPIDQPQAVVKVVRTALDDTSSWILLIIAQPDDCNITVDGVLYTTGTASLANYRNLNPVISIEKAGFSEYFTTLHMEKGFKYELSVSLARKTGWLTLESNIPIQQVLVDGINFSGTLGRLPIPAGYHQITARSFGYKDLVANLVIEENTVHEYKAVLALAPFEAKATAPSRSRFRPGNPGSLGTSTIKFMVSGPGHGTLNIISPDGVKVISHDFDRFSTWDQSYTWDGKDQNDKVLPEGNYQWHIVATAAPAYGGASLELDGHVAIDNSSFLKARLSGHGCSGSSATMDTYVLETGGFSLGTSLGYDFKNNPESSDAILALDSWIRGTVYSGLELAGGVETGIESTAASSPSFFIFGGIKYQLLKPRNTQTSISLALGLEGTGLISATPLPALRSINGDMTEVRLSVSTQLNADIFFAALETGLALTPYTLYDTATDLSLVPRPAAGLSLGLDSDAAFFCIGARTEFLPFDYLINGYGISQASSTSTALAAWGMLAPPRISADLILTSPWNLAFGLSFHTDLYPSAGFLDYPGIVFSILFVE